MSKKQDLVKAQSNEVVTQVNMSEWGDVVVESKDLLLPKILLLQAISEVVKQREGRDGDYYNTLLGEVCSNDKGEISILPFYCRQSYTVEKWNGKKFEFLRSDPHEVGEVRQYEVEDSTGRYKYLHNYEFFCMLENGGTPASVTFRSTSHKAGQQLFNLMYVQNYEKGRTPAHNWITLGRREQTNDMGTFWVMDIGMGRESVVEEVKECLKWITVIKKSAYKVKEEKPSAPSHTTETRF